MADEPQSPTADDIESADFDWGRFFASSDEEPVAQEAPVAAPPAPVAASEDEDEEPVASDDTADLRAQVQELQKLVKETAKTATETITKTRVQSAVEEWKKTASPFELQMADVLSEATSLDDLKAKAALVKRVASSSDKVLESEKLKIEQDLQRQFGLPVTPTYQPMPEREKMDEALAEGDIDKAAALALKGFFR